jgi:hypothetical protein
MEQMDRIIRDAIIFGRQNPHLTEQQIKDFIETQKMDMTDESVVRMSGYMRALGEALARHNFPSPEWHLFEQAVAEFGKISDWPKVREKILAEMGYK